MTKVNNKLPIIILFIIFAFGIFKYVNKNEDSLILATIGEDNITVDQFINSYSFGSSALKPNPDPKLFFLNAMINEIVLARELSENKQYKIENDDSRIELLKQELVVENIFKIEVENTIKITKEEVLESILNSRKKIKITYLYSSSFDRIVQCRDSLLNGYELHQLLKIKTINDDIIIKETTYMEESQINEPFKNVIFKLSPKIFSKIIRTDLGYYIIRIDDVINNSLSEMEIKKLNSTHKKIIWNKKGEQLAKDFVDSYMSPKNITVKSKSFNDMSVNIYNIYKKFGTIPLDNTSYAEPNQYKDWLNDTLIVHKDGIIKTKQILDYIKIRPIQYDSRNIEYFSNDLEKKLAVIIRDYFLISENTDSYDFGHKDIISQINQWKRKLIVDDYLERLQTSFISDKIEKNNQLYELLNKKLDSLRSTHNISINLELLSDIDVIDDVKGHIPELQLFKLGLPYLRKAYPTPNLMFIYVN